MSRSALVKAGLLVVLIISAFVAVQVNGLPDVDSLRREVRATGAAGWLVFVVGYAVLVLFPTPASVLTIAGGALFGLWVGAGLALLGAVAGAVGAYEIARLLGRDAASRLTRGRLARVDRLLSDHGLASVVAVRLVPIFPFTALNYACGVSGVGRRDYALGTAVGIAPGAVAYAAVGAYGTDPWRLGLAVAALVLLVLAGGAWGRRILSRHGTDPEAEAPGLPPGSRASP